MLFSISSSIIIVLAIPFGFRAIYVSTDIGFMTLIFIQLEIILDFMIFSVVLYNIAFSSSTGRDLSQFYADHDEDQKGIRDILSNRNLERLQKEILQAYDNNDLLKFSPNEVSRRENSSPERTCTENSERAKKDIDDRNSFYPISEIEAERSVSGDFNSTLRHDLTKRSTNRGDNDGRSSGSLEKNDNFLSISRANSDQPGNKNFGRRLTSRNSKNQDSFKLSKQLIDSMRNSKIQGSDS
jgi:HD superfamily phosphohydrolase